MGHKIRRKLQKQCHGKTTDAGRPPHQLKPLDASESTKQQNLIAPLGRMEIVHFNHKARRRMNEACLGSPSQWRWFKREILNCLHDAPTAGQTGPETRLHPSLPICTVAQECVLGPDESRVATCKTNKNSTHRAFTLFRIPTTATRSPFQPDRPWTQSRTTAQRTVRFVLTIVDPRMLPRRVCLPWQQKVTGPESPSLFSTTLPRLNPIKVISDRDPRFTAHFWTRRANKIGVKQNLSHWFHLRRWAGGTDESMVRAVFTPHRKRSTRATWSRCDLTFRQPIGMRVGTQLRGSVDPNLVCQRLQSGR